MAASRLARSQVREICDGRWGEQQLAIFPPDPSNICSLKLIVISPDEAPTASYIFTLDFDVHDAYPFKAPMIVFDHKIWHPRVSIINGTICLRQLGGADWRPEYSLTTLGLACVGMLRDPGDIPSDERAANNEAHDEIKEDKEVYKKHALEWAEKDNSGYGMVKFEDLRLAAIQSCLLVPDLIPYECHFYCQSYTSNQVKLIAIILPRLRIYQEYTKKKLRMIVVV